MRGVKLIGGHEVQCIFISHELQGLFFPATLSWRKSSYKHFNQCPVQYQSLSISLPPLYSSSLSTLTLSTLATALRLSAVGLDFFHLDIDAFDNPAFFSNSDILIPLSVANLSTFSYSNLSPPILFEEKVLPHY